ncbi:MAG: MoaD/ThiS family protein [Bacteroidia bacterium]|nr:MoaD/ThiS family protein [Bacteroidia bacterium]
MRVNVIIFGQLKDIIHSKSLVVEEIGSTDKLIQHLNGVYPELINSKYLIAVQKEIISSDTVLNNNDTVALLPPYAGG